MHMRDRCFGILGLREEDVGYPAVGHELLVHGHFEFGDGPVGAEDFVEVGGVDIFR